MDNAEAPSYHQCLSPPAETLRRIQSKHRNVKQKVTVTRNIATLLCPSQYVGLRGNWHIFSIVELYDVGNDSSPGIAYSRYVTNLSEPLSCSWMQLLRVIPTYSKIRQRGVKLFFTVRAKQRLRVSKNRLLRENIWTEDKESRRRVEKIYVRNFLTCTLRRILLRRWNGEMVGACSTHWMY